MKPLYEYYVSFAIGNMGDCGGQSLATERPLDNEGLGKVLDAIRAQNKALGSVKIVILSVSLLKAPGFPPPAFEELVAGTLVKLPEADPNTPSE